VNDTDEALVVRSQRGDRPAFEELVRRTARLVFARLYLDTGDSHRAEDLAQETYLTAWRRIAQLKDPSGLRPWLFSIAHSTLIDSIRREGRKKRSGMREGDEALSKVADGGAPPDAQLEAVESRQRVLSLLRSMPEEYRLPLTLRYIGGADYETIGRELGLTNGSLRGLLNRGIEKLRAAFVGADLRVRPPTSNDFGQTQRSAPTRCDERDDE
jgi:RNA polymerase sigma-70 factor (ECF subfamily)